MRSAHYRSAEGARTPPCPVRAKVSQAPTRPLSAPPPPQPGTPAAPATLSSLQRGQTIFPYESSHSLPDCFYILGSKFPARRPQPIFDVLSPTSRSDPLFPSGTAPCALRTPSCANHVALHTPFLLLGAFTSIPPARGARPSLPGCGGSALVISLPSLSLRSIPSLS